MSQTNTQLTERQKANLGILRENFGLSGEEVERILFFTNRDVETPWIPPDILQAIALQVGKFKYVGVTFDQFIEKLDQIIWTATVIDEQDRTFVRSGVALIGERPNGQEMDTNLLAGGRALSAALTAAGFNPFKAGTIAAVTRKPGVPPAPPLSDDAREIFEVTDSAALRGKDLRQIHALAEQCGLIRGKDQRLYRNWLSDYYHVNTAAVMDARTRASVINALDNFEMDYYLDGVPQELRADAAIA